MLSQAKQKWIRSLDQKKFRQELGLFLAEGSKCCTDLLELLPCRFLAATSEWLASLNGSLSLALDNVQDPGNLGTILRIADWFGIRNVLCSIGTADVFNPKTVQATMGAIGRIRIHYTDLPTFLATVKLPVYGTFLEGKVLYDAELQNEGIIVMGNEGNGISQAVEKWITDKLYIPDYPAESTGSESLNVSVATAIVCSEFRRRALQKV